MSEALNPEVLDRIQPWGGTEETGAERVIQEGRALQRVQTTYTTAVAVQKPRSISRISANVLEEAALAGRSFYYGWSVKNKDGSRSKIEGPSIDLAMCMARNYGNCVIEVEAEETVTHYQFRGVLIDLESGFTCPRLFRQRKNQSLGKFDHDRQEDIVFQVGQSKAIRNAIIRAMPEWLVSRAIEVAKKAELDGINPENIVEARGRALAYFTPYGVTEARISDKLSRGIDEWTPDDIVDLRGMATALKEGRVSAKELFPLAETKPTEPPPTQPETGADEAAEGAAEAAEAPAPPPEGLFDGLGPWTPPESLRAAIAEARPAADVDAVITRARAYYAREGLDTEELIQPLVDRDTINKASTRKWIAKIMGE